eukprot:1095313-Rhodomonas_salina.1
MTRHASQYWCCNHDSSAIQMIQYRYHGTAVMYTRVSTGAAIIIPLSLVAQYHRGSTILRSQQSPLHATCSACPPPPPPSSSILAVFPPRPPRVAPEADAGDAFGDVLGSVLSPVPFASAIRFVLPWLLRTASATSVPDTP